MKKRKPVDPVEVLEQIASDPHAPSTARVAAARALLALSRGGAVEGEVDLSPNAAAIVLLNKKGAK
jgi:hypothetical protein